MIDRLPYAFRTTIGAWVLVPVVVIEFMNFFQRGMPWKGEGIWTVEWMAISLFLLGPVIAGFAAVETARLFRPGTVHHITVPRHRYRSLWAVVAWCGLGVCAVHLCVTAAGLIVGQVPSSVDWASMFGGTLVQCLAILWYTAVGMLIGRIMPPMVAGAIAAVIGFGSFYILGSSYTAEEFALLDFGAATVSRLGLDYNPAYLGFQAAILLISALVMASVTLHPRGRTPLARWTAVGISAVMAAGLGVANGLGPDQRWIAVPTPPDTCVSVSADDTAWAEYCVYAEHQEYIDDLDAVYRPLRTAAVDSGYDAFVFEKAWELSRTYVPSPDEAAIGFTFVSVIHEEGHLDPYRLAYNLIYPEHCQALSSDVPPSDEFWMRMDRLSFTWISLLGIDSRQYELQSFSMGRVELLSPEEAQAMMDEMQGCNLTGSR
jgi:hypothetical protein